MARQEVARIVSAFQCRDRLMRLDASGALDPTFGTAGVAGGPLEVGEVAQSASMALAPDGSILVAGFGAPGGGVGARNVESYPKLRDLRRRGRHSFYERGYHSK